MKKQVELKEIKLTEVWEPSNDWVPLEFLISQTCQHQVSSNLLITVKLSSPGTCFHEEYYLWVSAHLVALYIYRFASPVSGAVICPVNSLVL